MGEELFLAALKNAGSKAAREDAIAHHAAVVAKCSKERPSCYYMSTHYGTCRAGVEDSYPIDACTPRGRRPSHEYSSGRRAIETGGKMDIRRAARQSQRRSFEAHKRRLSEVRPPTERRRISPQFFHEKRAVRECSSRGNAARGEEGGADSGSAHRVKRGDIMHDER